MAGLSEVAPTSVSLSHSHWPAQGSDRINPAILLAEAGTGSYALAMQSTDPLPLSERIRLSEMANPGIA
ncbi:MAG: hypothetical protein H7245_17020 [Candidatus Saccharibacteria bacterium]|nr:hypothetical protein [Pseudorhodobacter sp.]